MILILIFLSLVGLVLINYKAVVTYAVCVSPHDPEISRSHHISTAKSACAFSDVQVFQTSGRG